MSHSIPHFLSQTANQFGDKDFIVSQSGSVTYDAFYRDVLATAESLRELGVGPDDRVGICMEKSIDQVCVILAILFTNAVIVPILPRLKQANISHIITNSGMVALITDSSRISEVQEFSDATKLVVGQGQLEAQWPNLAYMRRHIKGSLFFDRIGKDNAAIIYSSGSTGRPKGILLSHRNLADGAEIVASYLGTCSSDRICSILSFNFDYGLNQIWQTVLKGATLYLHDLAMPNDLFSLLSEKKITALPIMPVIITQMFIPNLYRPNPENNYTDLRYVCSTGGRLSEKMVVNLRAAFPKTKLFSMFGLTEAFRSTYLEPSVFDSRPTSIGKAIPDTEILVLDPDGKKCATNEIGELVQRGATVAKGYWNDPENTAKVFRTHSDYPGEVLVYSGDNVTKDEEGYLYFVSRRDDMIKTRGFRVSPMEVESEVVTHPKIQGAVAFGITNIEVGQDIVCAYATSDSQPLDERNLTQYLKNKLPRHMVPAYLSHFEEFPITGSGGKIDRKSIIESTLEKLGVNRDPTKPHLNSQ